MNIYIEFKRDCLRMKVGNDQIEIKVHSNFYSPIPGTESFYMFQDNKTINRLKELIKRQKNNLRLFTKLKYQLLRNRVLTLVDTEVQDMVTVEQIYSYATLFLDGRVIFVIKKPSTFDST